MKKHIITEEQIKGILDYFAEEDNDQLRFAAYDIIDTVKSSQYDPQVDRGKILDEVIELLDDEFPMLQLVRQKIEELR
jgi:hypothetical protein